MALPDYIEGWYGEELMLIVHLTDQSNTKLFKVNPTLASGDAKCITRLNGSWGSRANLGTLPAVVDASGSAVLVIVSAAEMTGDLVVVELRDAAGDQWCDAGITIVPRKPVGSTLVRTTIATLASQTSFTLTGGSADNDAYNGLPIVIEDASTLVQRCVGIVSDYVGLTKTVTLLVDPAVFEMAVGDRVFIVASDQRPGTILDRIGAFTGSGVNTVLGFLKAVMSKSASTPSDVGGTFSATTDALEALQEEIASHDTGTGSGARSVLVTVNDGATALQNARVRLQQGAESYVANTNASGQIEFSVDDATWSVRITKAGYTFTPATLVVDDDKTPTYSMTSTTPAAPANPSLATGSGYCYDESGVAEEGVTITCWMTEGPGDDGYHWDTSEFTMTSDVNGLVSHAFVRGATYKANRGTSGRSVEFTVPTDSGNFDLPEVLGSP